MPGNHLPTEEAHGLAWSGRGLSASNSATSLSEELSSEILGAEPARSHLPESLQPEAGIRTQDEGKDRVQRVTHMRLA